MVSSSGPCLEVVENPIFLSNWDLELFMAVQVQENNNMYNNEALLSHSSSRDSSSILVKFSSSITKQFQI